MFKTFLKALRKYIEEQRRLTSALIKDLERERIAIMGSHQHMMEFIDAYLDDLEKESEKSNK